jgi:NAD(P)H-dependent FMN reductase
MALDTVVIYGSVRSDRLGIRVVRFIDRALRDRGHAVTVVDPLVEQLPLLDRMYKEYAPGTAPPVLERLAARYRAADAFVVVSGEYNHSIPPALSNLLDHFLEEYFFRPSAIACYSTGGYGGVRAAMQLRAMLGELGMPSIANLFPVARVSEAFTDEGIPREDELVRRFDRFASELEWYASALREARKAGVPY